MDADGEAAKAALSRRRKSRSDLAAATEALGAFCTRAFRRPPDPDTLPRLTALAEQILKLAADGRSYLQMKQHAVESAKRFSIEETTRKMCELYRLHLANL